LASLHSSSVVSDRYAPSVLPYMKHVHHHRQHTHIRADPGTSNYIV
jgi:hypothetical protein